MAPVFTRSSNSYDIARLVSFGTLYHISKRFNVLLWEGMKQICSTWELGVMKQGLGFRRDWLEVTTMRIAILKAWVEPCAFDF